MKAITYNIPGDAFTLAEIPIPELQTEHDVLVNVHAVGLNPVDAKVNFWHGMIEHPQQSFVGGLDVSGEIIAIGSAVKAWKPGDMVLYHGNMRRNHGGFAEYAIQDSRTLLPHPAVSAEVAAATPCAGWTAYRALVDKLDIASRDSILIAGGSGGVGSFAIQIAKSFALDTIIVTCSESNRQYVSQLGATAAIDYQSEDVVKRVMALTSQLGVDVALDCVGGDNDLLAASALRFEGEMVELVKPVNATLYPNAFLQGLSFHQLSLGAGHVNGDRGRASIVNAGKAVSGLLESGQLKVPALKIIPLEQVADSLVAIRNQRTVGKIVAKLV